MASVSELLSVYENADALSEAEAALDQIAATKALEDLPLGYYYDGLAEVADEEGDFPLAARAQRRAIEHGCEHPELALSSAGWESPCPGHRSETSRAGAAQGASTSAAAVKTSRR